VVNYLVSCGDLIIPLVYSDGKPVRLIIKRSGQERFFLPASIQGCMLHQSCIQSESKHRSLIFGFPSVGDDPMNDSGLFVCLCRAVRGV
jgi:hypothetical protein